MLTTGMAQFADAQPGLKVTARRPPTEETDGLGSDQGITIPPVLSMEPVQSHPIAIADLGQTILRMRFVLISISMT